MRELAIKITADGRQALETFRAVDRAQAQTETSTKKLATAQGGLVDAYGKAVRPTQEYAAAQESVNTKKKAAASITEQLNGALLRYVSGAVMVSAIDQTIKYGSGLDKLAVTLGTTIRGVQELENIAIRSNTTVEQLSTSIFQMEMRLLNGDKGAVAAIRELKINLGDFTRLPMEQKLFALNDAFKQLGERVDQDRVGAALFGRDWRHVLDAVTGDAVKMKNGLGLASDEAVKGAADAEVAWNSFLTESKRGALEFFLFLHDAAAAPFKFGGFVWDKSGVGRVVDQMAEPFRDTTPALPTAPALPGQPDLKRGASGYIPMGAAVDPSLAFRIQEMNIEAERRRQQQRQIFAGIQTQDAALAPDFVGGQIRPSVWLNWLATQRTAVHEGPLGSMSAIPGMFGASGEGFGSNSMIFGRTIGNGLGTGPADLAGTSSIPGRGFFGRTGITGDALSQIGMMAATGGGNIGQAAGGLLAGGAVTSLMTDSMGKMMGGTLGSFLPGIGTILGTLAGGALGKLFGPSEESLKVNKPREDFFEQRGGLKTLNPQLLQATGSFQLAQDLFNAKTEKQSTAAMEAITVALDTYITKLKEGETALAAVTTKTQLVTEVTPEMQSAIDATFLSTNIDDYNANLAIFGGLVDEQITKQKELDETLKKYGISWTEAGDAAKMAKLADIASGLAKEFDILRGAGVDVNVVMRSMGPHVNQFVKDAQKAGVEVPESFKRVIQTAIDAGEIFDANGAAVKDITTLGLTFGSTMQDVQRDMVDSMKELARVLRETLGGAFTTVKDTAREEFGKIPRKIDIEVDYRSEGYDVGDRSHSGSVIRPWGLERFHTGGLLSDERLIIGQTGEAVLNRRAVANMGASAVHAWNRGETPSAHDPELRNELKGLRSETKGLRSDLTTLMRQLPDQFAAVAMGPRQR